MEEVDTVEVDMEEVDMEEQALVDLNHVLEELIQVLVELEQVLVELEHMGEAQVLVGPEGMEDRQVHTVELDHPDHMGKDLKFLFVCE